MTSSRQVDPDTPDYLLDVAEAMYSADQLDDDDSYPTYDGWTGLVNDLSVWERGSEQGRRRSMTLDDVKV